MLPPRVFVTGTGTGVGKTFISAVLTAGLSARYWKPIQSGVMEPPDSPTDSSWVSEHLEIAAQRIIPETYVFPTPVSPHQASEIAGQPIESAKIIQQFKKLDQSCPLVVEGAGGILVPINERELVIDLIMQLALPVILVSSTTLGTINHTLLTVEALRTRGVPIAGVILNGFPNPSTKRAIESFASVSIMAEVPQIELADRKTLHKIFDDYFLAK